MEWLFKTNPSTWCMHYPWVQKTLGHSGGIWYSWIIWRYHVCNVKLLKEKGSEVGAEGKERLVQASLLPLLHQPLQVELGPVICSCTEHLGGSTGPGWESPGRRLPATCQPRRIGPGRSWEASNSIGWASGMLRQGRYSGKEQKTCQSLEWGMKPIFPRIPSSVGQCLQNWNCLQQRK